MIAAGSLFTSCVTNTEPQGVRDLREAKADYIESLAKLNAANEALVAAEAAYKNAEAEVKAAEVAVVEAQAAQAQAIAAQEQAYVDLLKAQIAQQEIINAKAQAELEKQIALDSIEVAQELLKAANFEVKSKADLEADIAAAEAKIAKAEADIANYEKQIAESEKAIAKAKSDAEQDAKQAEIDLIKKQEQLVIAQHNLAIAEEAFRTYLYKIELGSYTLTTEEKAAVAEYKEAYDSVIAAKQWIRKVEELIYENDTTVEGKYDRKLQGLKNTVTADSTQLAQYKKWLAEYQDKLNNLPDSGKTLTETKALQEEYEKQLKDLNYQLANIKNEYKTYKATELGEPVIAYTTELSEWIVANAALPAPFDMRFKAELPDNGAVSALFASCIAGVQGVEVDTEKVTKKAYVVANFETSSDALKGIQAIDSVIDAISRKYMIENVGIADLDTAGLKDAVAAAEAEYKAIADTLEKGLSQYAAVVAAQDSIDQAVADTATAYEAYRAAVKDTVKKSKNKTKAEGELKDAKDTLAYYEGEDGFFETAKKDSIQFNENYQVAVSNLEKAEADKDSVASVVDSLVDLSENLESLIEKAGEDVALTQFRKDNAETNKVAAVNKFTHAQDSLNKLVSAAASATGNAKDSLLNLIPGVREYVDAAKADTVTAHNAFTQAKTAYDNAKSAYEALKAITPTTLAQKIADAKEKFASDSLNVVEKDSIANVKKVELDSVATHYAQVVTDTLKFTEAKAQAEKDTAKFNKQYRKSIAAEAKAAGDTLAAVEFLDRAVKVLYPAAKESFYKNIYCKFWGIDTSATNYTTIFKDNDPTKFLKDSIPYKDFTEVFKGEGIREIVKFKPTYSYTKADGFTGTPALVNNAEIKIILERLEKDYKVTDFEKTLLCQLFAKQQSAQDIFAAVGTIDNDEALAALTQIKKDLDAEFKAAGEKQEASSQPFFTYVEELFGAEFINTVYDRIDAAITKYAEYIDESVNPSKMDLIAKAVVKGDVTAKQIFIYWVESKFTAQTGYRAKYVNLQVAGAFAGEEFKQFVAEILAAKIEKNNKVAGTLEEELFNAIDLTNASIPDFAGSLKNILSNDTIKTYIKKDFGGKIAELQEKHLAGWKEVWTKYQADSTSVQAQIAVITTLNTNLSAYTSDTTIASLISDATSFTNEIKWLEGQIKIAEAALALAEETLAAFVAGPDIYEQHKAQELAEKLAAAQLKLSVAEERLKVATAAYERVLANHTVTE